MSVSNGLVSLDGINLHADINALIGAASSSNSHVCRSININKCSKRKPTRYPGNESDINNQWRGLDGQCGFAIHEYTSPSMALSSSEALQESDPGGLMWDWVYLRPRGGESEPWREGDFRGYYHYAAKLVDRIDYDISKSMTTFQLVRSNYGNTADALQWEDISINGVLVSNMHFALATWLVYPDNVDYNMDWPTGYQTVFINQNKGPMVKMSERVFSKIISRTRPNGTIYWERTGAPAGATMYILPLLAAHPTFYNELLGGGASATAYYRVPGIGVITATVPKFSSGSGSGSGGDSTSGTGGTALHVWAQCTTMSITTNPKQLHIKCWGQGGAGTKALRIYTGSTLLTTITNVTLGIDFNSATDYYASVSGNSFRVELADSTGKVSCMAIMPSYDAEI